MTLPNTSGDHLLGGVKRGSFEYVGPILGYRAKRPSKFGGRWSVKGTVYDPAYTEYKKALRLLANVQGCPDAIHPNGSASVIVTISWRLRAKIDGKNVLGAVEDALFERDRRVFHGEYSVFEYVGQERLMIAFSVAGPVAPPPRRRKE